MTNNDHAKRVAQSGIIILTLSILVFSGWRVTHGASQLPQDVTVESIRAVQNGMTEKEVVAILGDPLERSPSVIPNATMLTYSKPVYFAKWYPMLWVHLRDGVVISVYAKRYIDWGADDVGVYGTEDDRQWETSLFEQTFPLQEKN